MGYDEYYKFETAMEANEKDWRQTREIQKMIERIGDLYGAVEEKFGSEGIFERLPNATYKFYDSDGETDYGLRLYCIRVNNEAVILLNGARKTTQNPRDFPNCSPHFDFAEKLAEAFYDAKLAELITIDGKSIEFEEDFYLEINYP